MTIETLEDISAALQAILATTPKKIEYIWKTGIPQSYFSEFEFWSELLYRQPFDGLEWRIACSQLNYSNWGFYLCCDSSTAERIGTITISGKLYKKQNSSIIFCRPLFQNKSETQYVSTPERIFIGLIPEEHCERGTEIEVHLTLQYTIKGSP